MKRSEIRENKSCSPEEAQRNPGKQATPVMKIGTRIPASGRHPGYQFSFHFQLVSYSGK